MFTGIIQSIGKLKQEKNILEIEIIDNLFDMAIGDSIAVDGICLTVKEIFQNKFTVDVSEETLKKTTLGVKSNLNQIVNLEPALRVSDRLGGHIVSGHVDGLGTVENIEILEKSWLLSIKWKNNNFSIVKEKKIQIEKSEAERFYKVHETKPFYNDLCTYLSLALKQFFLIN